MEYKPNQRYVGFCTKYALTKGIAKTTAEVGTNNKYGRAVGGGVTGAFMVLDKEFFINKEDAEVRVRHMIMNKKRSLQLQLKKLDEMLKKPLYYEK